MLFNIIFKISSLFILFIINFENERNIRHKISSIIQYVNNIADMYVILLIHVFKYTSKVFKYSI